MNNSTAHTGIPGGKLMMRLLKGAALLAACILAGLLAMTAVYAIPAEHVRGNMEMSSAILSSEGLRYEVIPGYQNSRLDTFTDAIMLANAMVMPEDSPLKNALLAHRLDSLNTVAALEQYLADEQSVATTPYSYYWHGYLTVLKPLLCVGSLGSIRFLLTAVQVLLMMAVAALLGRRGMTRFVVPLLAMAVCLCPQALMNCLTYSTVFTIGMAAAAVILLAHERLERLGYGYAFLLIGAMTSFFDFLTYPVFTLGIPLAVYVLVLMENGERVRFDRLAALCVTWGVGYGGMWAGKWVLVSALTDINGIEAAVSEILVRTSNTMEYGGNVEPLAGLLSCMERLLDPLNVLVLALCGLACAVLLVRRGVRREAAAGVGALALIALLPVVWLALTCNHSLSHVFYTYRSLAVMVFALLCIPLTAAGGKRSARADDGHGAHTANR